MATLCILLACILIHLATASLMNVALGKSASMSSSQSGYNASEAVDGDTDTGTWGADTIINTGSGHPFAWWKVDLEREVQGATVRIYFRTDYTWRRNGVKLYTSTRPFPESNSTSQGQLCHTVTGDPSGSNIPDVYSVTCPGRWRYLLLYTDTDNKDNGQSTGPTLDFGEVEVLFAESCSVGLYGDACTKHCNSRHCLNMQTTCDKDGTCPGGCQNGWTGLDCTVCSDGLYGDACTKPCNSRRCLTMPTTCDKDGRCPNGCQNGWTGLDCTACSGGLYGDACTKPCNSRHCRTMPTTCDKDGTCPGGCQNGWTGLDCTVLPPCPDSNNYGLNCDKLCSDRKCKAPSTSSCDRLTGRCPDGCETGWRQEDCTQECPSDLYGTGCSSSCSARDCSDASSPCDHVTGQCVGGCKPGYRGTDCKQECESGFYGPGCSLSCPDRKCLDSSPSCDHVTGQCQCKAGYEGTDCRRKCGSSFYGPDCSLSCTDRKCRKSSSQCDHVTGQCVGGCQAGYKGTDCITACSSGEYYGVDCSKSCSFRHCVSSTDCDPQTGQCPGGCESGWTGVDCADACTEGTYGPDCERKCGQCDGVCDSVDGRCPAGCLEGYNGTWCDLTLVAIEDTDDMEHGSYGVTSLVGAVVGTFLAVVLLGVGIHICLIRQGRLQWIKHLEDSRPVQRSRDFTEMSNIVTRPADVSEHAQSSNNAPINDYAELDSGTIRGNKDYDVIQTKHYENL